MKADTKICQYCGEEIKSVAVKCKYCGSLLVDMPNSRNVDLSTYIKMALSAKYEVISQVGQGGMNVVYKAIQRNLDRPVALKILSPQLTFDTEFVDRFHKEARVAARLNHPNIIRIFDEGIEHNVHYISMELLEGIDLHRFIAENGILSAEALCRIIIPVASALDYAHKYGYVHRDVKSGNIFLNNDGRIVLTDFGIAHSNIGTQLTISGTVLGTPEFMSPEQAKGIQIDSRSDIYSLGVVMYHCLTGRLPFCSDNPIITISKILNENYTPIRMYSPVPVWLEKIINSCLLKDRNQRIQTCGELINLLNQKNQNRKTQAPEYAKTIKIKNKSNFVPANHKIIKPKIYHWKKYTGVIISVVLFLLLVLFYFLYQANNTDKGPDYVKVKEPNKKEGEKKSSDPTVEEPQDPDPIKAPPVVKYITLDNVVGEPIMSAKKFLEISGFEVKIILLPNSLQNKGFVISQSPGSGEYPKGTNVQLMVGE